MRKITEFRKEKGKKSKVRGEYGITLIALVITIVVMLILAGVTINLTLGENGIFTTAQQVAKNYTEAQNKELSHLQGFTNEVDNIVNPAPLGTIIKTENGINHTADGAGNTIPVPVGFVPITTAEGQGTKLTGFVIRDTSVDSEGNPTATNGNEFVWVPVEGMNYTYNRYAMLDSQPEDGLDAETESMKIKYSTTNEYNFIERMPNDEEKSVSIYGGYYIGRYETGIKDYDKANVLVSPDGSKTWTGYTGGNLVIQKGQQVWNYITRDRAVTESTKLYNKTENNVTSKLCSSYAWDTALKFIETQNSTYPTNSVGGYYSQWSPTATGYDTTHPCNIYDMGGNVWEWTTESNSLTDYNCVVRGGHYNAETSQAPAAARNNGGTTGAAGHISFRVTLFI